MSDFFNYTDTDNVFNNLVSNDPSVIESKDALTDPTDSYLENESAEMQDGVGPGPKRKSKNTLDQQLQKNNSDFLTKLATPTPMSADNFVGSAVKSVSPEYVNKFKAQEGYNPLEFNPYMYESNTQKAIENETWGSALAKGFDSMLYNAGNTYTSWFSDYGKMFDAISEGDWDAVKPEESELIRQYYDDQKNADKNYVFVPEEDEDGIFNKKFFSEFLGNVGFTYGTIAAIGTELAADVIITGLTGGAGIESFGVTGARALSKLGLKAAAKEGVELAVKRNFFADFGRGLSMADKSLDAIKPMVREAAEAEIMASSRIATATGREVFNSYTKIFSNNILNIAKSKSVGEFAENILRGTPLLGTTVNFGEKGIAAYKAGAGTAELIGMGLQGSRRVAQELNMSMSEAMFESVSSYGDSLDMMIKNYQDSNNGDLPQGLEFNKMRDYAMQASSSNYDTNAAILLVTNKLQFGNLFNKFLPANKTLQAIQDTMITKTVAGVGKKGAFKIFDKSGFFGTFGIVGKVKAEFGKKEAAKLLGKSILRNSLSFEVAEGAQEIYQEASGTAWKNYYSDKYANNTKYSLSEYFGQGFKDQWSKQGLKTFLTGALTGMLVKGPSRLLNNIVEKGQEQYYNNQYKDNPTQNPLTQAKEKLKADIQMINSVFQAGGPNAFSNKIINFNAQTIGSAEMTEAAAKGLQYEFQNSKNNTLLAATMAAYRTNTIDGFVNALKEMGKEYSAEAFNKEFNINITDTKYNTPQEYAEKVASDLQKYTKLIEDITRGAKNRLVDIESYELGTPDRGIANHTRKAQEEAISIIAMNAIKADMTAKRIQDLTTELSVIPGLGLSSDYAMRVLSNPSFLQNEIVTVESQIKQLTQTINEGNLTGDVKKETQQQLKYAQKEFDLLNDWKKLWKSRAEITGVKEHAELVFAGIELNKKQRVENAEGKKLWTPTKTWNIKDKKISSLFRNIINHKNLQAGLDTELSQTSLNDSFDKIVDYIRLNRDTKDYMEAVEVLSDPDKYMSMVKKAEVGLYKYNLEDALTNKLEKAVARTAVDITAYVTKDTEESIVLATEIYNQIFKKVKESDAYIALNIIVTDSKVGIESYKQSRKYFNDIEKIISLETHKIIKAYTPQEYNEDISEGKMNEIKSSKIIDEFRLLSIAEKKMTNTELLPNEQILYDDPAYKLQIDEKIEELQILGYAPKVEIIDNGDGTADVIDIATGNVVNNEPITVEKAEELKKEIDNLPSNDPVIVAPAIVPVKAPVIPVEEEDEDYINDFDEVSDNYLLREFLAMSNASKIKTLELTRDYNPAYQALKTQFGKQLIQKDVYELELDKINSGIFVEGAEEITLKSLLDSVKALNSNTSSNVNSQPNQPASTAPSQVSTPVSTNPFDIMLDIDAKKADIERRRQAGTNVRGTTYKGETTEKDGLKVTKYSEFNSESKRISKGGRIMTPAEFIKEYNIIDQDYLDSLEGATEIRIYEVRVGKDGKAGISIQATFPEGNVEMEVAGAKLAAEEQPATPSLNVKIPNTDYEINNNEILYNGKSIILDLKTNLDLSKVAPLDIIKLHIAQREKEAKGKKTTLAKQLKELNALQKELDSLAKDAEAEQIVDDNLDDADSEQIEKDREVVVDRMIDDNLDDVIIQTIAEEEEIDEKEVKAFISKTVRSYINNGKKIPDGIGKTAKKIINKILTAIAAIVISGFAIYSGPVQSLIKKTETLYVEDVVAKKDINFTTSSFTVTPIEGCSAFVNNQIRAVIGTKGQQDLNMYGDAWTSTYNMVNTNRGEYVYNIFENAKKPLLTDKNKITSYIKNLLDKAPVVTSSMLQEGDIVNLFYENSSNTLTAWKEGKGVYTSHVGIVKRNNQGNLVIEDNVHGIISNHTIEQLNKGEYKSLDGSVKVVAIARPDYAKAGFKIKEIVKPSKTTTPEPTTPIEKASLFGLAFLLRRKRDEGIDITTELTSNIKDIKSQIKDVQQELQSIKNDYKIINSFALENEVKKSVVKTAAPVVDMQKAEALVRQMVVPNGKKITDLTSEEQQLISNVPLERKIQIQEEEQKKWQDEQDLKLKKDDDYSELSNDYEDEGQDFEDLFGDEFEIKIAQQKANREFTKKFLKTEDEDLINAFMSKALETLDAYNKEVNGTLVSLDTLSRTPSMKSTVEDIRSNVLASVADEFDETDAVDFEDFFDMENLPEVESTSKIIVDVNKPTVLQVNDLQSILEDYNQAKSDISKKSSKFVMKGDQSLLDEINNIHDEPGC